MIERKILLRPGASIEVGDEIVPATLIVGQARIGLGVRPKGIRSALDLLAGRASTEMEMVEAVMDLDGEEAVIGFQLLMRRLRGSGMVVDSVWESGSAAFTSIPVTYCAPKPAGDAGNDAPLSLSLSLSRFVSMRPDPDMPGSVAVESPLSPMRFVLHQPRLAGVVASFAHPEGYSSIAAPAADSQHPAHSDGEAGKCLAVELQRWGFLVDAGSSEADAARYWNPEDLAFHRASRMGTHTRGYGGTYRLTGIVPPIPGARTKGGAATPLPPVDVSRLCASDPPLASAMESRRSTREHDDATPITAGQLGELLYRTMRVERRFSDEYEDLLYRPVPSGGALHPIDAYLAVRLCDGLDAGLYRYDGDGHGLVLVSGDHAAISSMISSVPLAPGRPELPQVLMILSARFGRAMWKYESMAYSLILKDLGVIIQSVYLAATAMGLAVCAQGGGDSAQFERIAGLNPLEESSVGEITLGSLSPSVARDREGRVLRGNGVVATGLESR